MIFLFLKSERILFMNLKTFLQSKPASDRCHLLDTLRGMTVINMVLFHAVWDLVYIFGMKWNWYHGQGAYLWQQGICWSFILLSGFCSGMSRHLLRRGLTVFGLGAVITLITAIFMPENLILFGVLTLIGSCMLLMAGCRKLLQKIPAVPGMLFSFSLFAFTKHANDGSDSLSRLSAGRILFNGLFFSDSVAVSVPDRIFHLSGIRSEDSEHQVERHRLSELHRQTCPRNLCSASARHLWNSMALFQIISSAFMLVMIMPYSSSFTAIFSR